MSKVINNACCTKNWGSKKCPRDNIASLLYLVHHEAKRGRCIHWVNRKGKVHKMKKTIFAAFICCFLFVIPSNVGAYTVPECIRVGLHYGSSAVGNLSVQSDWGLAVGYYSGDSFVNLYESAAAAGTMMPVSGAVYVSGVYGTAAEARGVSSAGFLLYREGGYCVASREPIDGFAQISLPESTIALVVDGNAEFAYTGEKTGVYHRGSGFINAGGKQYRDGLELIRSGSSMTVINVVGLEHYLYGVVPGEMPSSFEMEALKAQAVCARNYAMRSMGNYAQYGFDVTPDTSSQMYLGVEGETERTTAAVDQTAKNVLLYDGEPALTVYSSMSGGATENVVNVWVSEVPYLCGVDDPYEHCENINGGTWREERTPEQIAASLAAVGMSVGTVTNVSVEEYTPAGGVLRLKITGTEGSCELQRESTRTTFGFRSQKYTVNGGGQTQGTVTSTISVQDNREARYENAKIGGNAKEFLTASQAFASEEVFWAAMGITQMQTQTQTVTSAASNTGVNENGVFVFEGRGYGHGLGMSQWGAQGMAEAGFSYEDILAHYYPGTVLQK